MHRPRPTMAVVAMAETTETTKAADRVGAATKTEPSFARGRHLLFAVAGLAHAPLIMGVGRVVLPSMGARAWSAEAVVVCDLIALCYAAFVAWIAFVVFDTNAGVAAWPRRWRALGAVFAVWCVGLEVFTAVSIWRAPGEVQEFARFWLSTFAESGDLRFGWLVAAMLAAAAAEEIVYRALLLRALESACRRSCTPVTTSCSSCWSGTSTGETASTYDRAPS